MLPAVVASHAAPFIWYLLCRIVPVEAALLFCFLVIPAAKRESCLSF